MAITLIKYIYLMMKDTEGSISGSLVAKISFSLHLSATIAMSAVSKKMWILQKFTPYKIYTLEILSFFFLFIKIVDDISHLSLCLATLTKFCWNRQLFKTENFLNSNCCLHPGALKEYPAQARAGQCPGARLKADFCTQI